MKWLAKLAWKNIWRNRNRTIITMASVFFAVILSVLANSLQTGTFDNLVKNVVSFYTGYLQVHKAGYWNEQILDNSFEVSASTKQKILSQQNIRAVAARLESFALASSADVTKGCLVAGIDAEEENNVTGLKQKLIAGSYLQAADAGVLLAQGLADRLQLKVNDTIVLIAKGYHGATAAGKYAVKGILKFGSPDLNDKALLMALVTAQDFYGAPGMVTSYVLSLNETKSLQATATTVQQALGSNYEIMTWEQLMPDIKQHIKADADSMRYVLGVLYMLICFGVFSTLLMMMVERKYEMGMLVAIGMHKRLMMLLLLIESLLTVLAGCVLGILTSVPIVYIMQKYPIRLSGESAKAYERFGFEAIFPTSTDASIFISQGLIVLVIGSVLSLYPVYKVFRLHPVTAMKR
ncbi:ABC-type lipoprotein release transport system permease subunit [Lacibacter cauensis]|uniref:ABC-type lipoprotein release transport system permease subunit n=1 Tax=Lacibacter cauensis TaxID=510947 RepID=A0A562SF77_9BACT|nr:FtsX-like permease family protein [Lacibacter cauensis]TWI79280.1 ABC-type lipoprotein release transport system permease subunit [Lacibacter cauensis]